MRCEYGIQLLYFNLFHRRRRRSYDGYDIQNNYIHFRKRIRLITRVLGSLLERWVWSETFGTCV